MDLYGFYTGKLFDAHRWLGCHRENDRVIFRVFAPHASRITLISDCNHWEEWDLHPVRDQNFWELQTTKAHIGDRYLYRIYRGEHYVDHCDPYGRQMDLRPAFCSIVPDEEFCFSDDAWLQNRTNFSDKPLNIYEIHLGSWRRHSDGSWLSYTELITSLIPYLKEMGYNCVEILPIAEHPLDESWGYQITGFFAPTARYGKPHELKAFINACHQEEIAVILDFIPVHFAIDSYGLGRFDGEALYEYPNKDVGYTEWGSYQFAHSRGEVRSFLQSNALYWLEDYHFDGLRMDAISRMIYWHGDPKRGVNGNAVECIRFMNQGLKARVPNCMLCAEDSTDFPHVTDESGLAFDYKWDMGFMHDTLDYFQTPPFARIHHSGKLTFSMHYFRNERYLLPLSHDENVHGKATILQKMHGEYEGKFAQGRLLYLYIYIHPGKKLTFMGSEFGQLREWDESREQDWEQLTYPKHHSFQQFLHDLNHIYLEHSPLFAWDYQSNGFAWLDCNQFSPCVFAIARIHKSKRLVFVGNFENMEQCYDLYVPHAEVVEVLLSTDEERYGGSTRYQGMTFVGEDSHFFLSLPPHSGFLLQVQ